MDHYIRSMCHNDTRKSICHRYFIFTSFYGGIPNAIKYLHQQESVNLKLANYSDYLEDTVRRVNEKHNHT